MKHTYRIILLVFVLLLILFIGYCKPASAEAPTVEGDIPPVLARIAMCESRNVEYAKNPTSTASGRFQWLKSSWNYYGTKLWGEDLKNKDVFDYWDNTELAVYVYKLNGTSDWNASRACWNKK